MTSIIALLQLALSLLISVQMSDVVTVAQRKQALSIATAAAQVAMQYVAENPSSVVAESEAPVLIPEVSAPAVVLDAPVVEPSEPMEALVVTWEPQVVEQPKTIQVRQVSHDRLEILNNTGVALRVKKIEIPGAAIKEAKVGAWTYETKGKYPMFDCIGLKSLGTYPSYGNPATDPCKRMDSNIPRNELQPGETMTLRFDGTFGGLEYATGRIVEVETGKDVQF